MLFENREEGGRKLGELLLTKNYVHPIVVGLPRGGVITAWEVAQQLDCPLQVVIIRKIGSPIDPEYGIGAMSEDEECFFSPGADLFDVESYDIKKIIEMERLELRRRIKEYRGEELRIPSQQTIIVVDDGLATGVTASCAAKFLKKFNPQKIILAVPVGPRIIRSYLSDLYDEIVILERPLNFLGVGNWYKDFKQTSDEEVLEILNPHKKGDVS